jgi:hypothetical protein
MLEHICIALPIAMVLHQDIEHVPVLIDRPPEVAVLAVYGDEDFT